MKTAKTAEVYILKRGTLHRRKRLILAACRLWEARNYVGGLPYREKLKGAQ